MMPLKNFSADLKAMFSAPQTPASQKPSTDPRRVWIAVLFLGLTLGFGIVFGLLSRGSANNSEKSPSANAETENLSQNADQEGSLVINFKDGARSSGSSAIGVSSGTLVRVRLQNIVETFETVPIFVQITDYALGERYYGWTLVGDASGDSNVDRIKMLFKLIRSPRGNASSEIAAQGLSLDGTLGVRAHKVEGYTSRALTGGAKAGASSFSNSFKGNGDLSSFLFRALLQGLENEATSDLNSAYNRGVALKLDPGQEFFVQLTEKF